VKVKFENKFGDKFLLKKEKNYWKIEKIYNRLCFNRKKRKYFLRFLKYLKTAKYNKNFN